MGTTTNSIRLHTTSDRNNHEWTRKQREEKQRHGGSDTSRQEASMGCRSNVNHSTSYGFDEKRELFLGGPNAGAAKTEHVGCSTGGTKI